MCGKSFASGVFSKVEDIPPLHLTDLEKFSEEKIGSSNLPVECKKTQLKFFHVFSIVCLLCTDESRDVIEGYVGTHDAANRCLFL